jgi:phospholipase C
MIRLLASMLVLAFCVTACGGAQSPTPLPQDLSSYVNSGGSGSKYIKHVVIVIQENRSFDNFFATFPGADGATGGCAEPVSGSGSDSDVRPSHTRTHNCPKGDEWVPLKKVPLNEPCDWGHSWKNVGFDYDNGKMDGFSMESKGAACGSGRSGKLTYQYVDPKEIKPYWNIAEQYVLGDHMFQTQGSGSFTAHQDLIAGATIINKAKTKSLVDFPTQTPWGCDAPGGTKTSILLWSQRTLKDEFKGPYPCMSYSTLRDLLDAKKVSWKYYSPPVPGNTGKYWNAFDAIKAVREGPEWTTNIADPSVFFTDITGGSLPSVSWVVPDNPDSDHPTTNDKGPSWVASIVNAVGQSSYWDSTAVIVVWDDWGGFYDNEPPPFFDHWGGLGFRVPMLLVSAYARETSASQPGYISHTPYEFGSILKFVENVYGLGSLHTTDERATSIVDCFDFSQPARLFTAIPSDHSIEYFLHQKPSGLPVDTE